MMTVSLRAYEEVLAKVGGQQERIKALEQQNKRLREALQLALKPRGTFRKGGCYMPEEVCEQIRALLAEQPAESENPE